MTKASDSMYGNERSREIVISLANQGLVNVDLVEQVFAWTHPDAVPGQRIHPVPLEGIPVVCEILAIRIDDRLHAFWTDVSEGIYVARLGDPDWPFSTDDAYVTDLARRPAQRVARCQVILRQETCRDGQMGRVEIEERGDSRSKHTDRLLVTIDVYLGSIDSVGIRLWLMTRLVRSDLDRDGIQIVLESMKSHLGKKSSLKRVCFDLIPFGAEIIDVEVNGSSIAPHLGDVPARLRAEMLPSDLGIEDPVWMPEDARIAVKIWVPRPSFVPYLAARLEIGFGSEEVDLYLRPIVVDPSSYQRTQICVEGQGAPRAGLPWRWRGASMSDADN